MGGVGGERRGNLVLRTAGGGGRNLLLPPPALLCSSNHSVVRMLVSCRGAENIHIKYHGSIILLLSILAARLLEMITRTSSWEPTTVPNLFYFSNTEKTYWRDIFHEKISPYT